MHEMQLYVLQPSQGISIVITITFGFRVHRTFGKKQLPCQVVLKIAHEFYKTGRMEEHPYGRTAVRHFKTLIYPRADTIARDYREFLSFDICAQMSSEYPFRRKA